MRIAIAAAQAAALWTAGVPVAGADSIVVIEATRLTPPVLQAVIGERVTFVNRSGHMAHMEFGGSAAGHRVFQVPGEIWAVFHREGPHLYGRKPHDLQAVLPRVPVTGLVLDR